MKRAVFWLSLALTFTPVSFALAGGENDQTKTDTRGIRCQYEEAAKSLAEAVVQSNGSTDIRTVSGSGR